MGRERERERERERVGYSKVVILWTVRRALKLSLSLLDVQGDRKLPSIHIDELNWICSD